VGFYTGKNILVTGGAGIIGHTAINRLLQEGAYIRTTEYTTRKIGITDKNLEIIKCDLHSYEQCLEVTSDMDVVINLAALTRGAKGQNSDPTALIRNNVNPTMNMIDAACKSGVEIFGFVGSSTAYPDVDYPAIESEGHTGEPHACYEGVGWMNRYCERVCMYFHNLTKTKFAMIRTSSVYGPHDTFDPERCHVIPHLILKAHYRQNPYYVWGDGNQIRDFVYVEDVVDGMLETIIKHPNADPINIATGQPTTIRELACLITEIFNHRPEFFFDTSKLTMIPVQLIDVSKSSSLLSWSSKTSLRDGLEKTISWFEKNNKILVGGEDGVSL